MYDERPNLMIGFHGCDESLYHNHSLLQMDNMFETIITPDSNSLLLPIPADMVGKPLKVIAFVAEEEEEIFDRMSGALPVNEETIYIPQWQKDLVLAEQKRVEEDPSLLMSWERVKG